MRMIFGPVGTAGLLVGLITGAEAVDGRLAGNQVEMLNACVAGLEDNRSRYGPVIASPGKVAGSAAHAAAAISTTANHAQRKGVIISTRPADSCQTC